MTNHSLPVLNTTDDSGAFEVEDAVRSRYSAASQSAEPALCCAVAYDPKFLDVLPQVLIERDYGCGDPSRYVREGDRVLDLGCGGGKVCYIASQIVGPQGRVIGVDMNADMLALAREHRQEITQKIGWDNVAFHRGRIQDLSLDLEAFEQFLQQHPIHTADDWLEAQSWANRHRAHNPMIASDSVDVVVSNCVLNLVRPEDRRQLFSEVYRVLREGGRAVISDIVSDEPIPPSLQQDPKLWSGCISGAFVEHELLEAFADAGFHGMSILAYQEQPWCVVEGIELRSMTVAAYKGNRDAGLDRNHAVIYRGPWHTVFDDDGNRLDRGVRIAVSDVTFERLGQAPYAEHCILVPPDEPVARETAEPFEFAPGENRVRQPQETKSAGTYPTRIISSGCDPTGCC